MGHAPTFFPLRCVQSCGACCKPCGMAVALSPYGWTTLALWKASPKAKSGAAAQTDPLWTCGGSSGGRPTTSASRTSTSAKSKRTPFKKMSTQESSLNGKEIATTTQTTSPNEGLRSQKSYPAADLLQSNPSRLGNGTIGLPRSLPTGLLTLSRLPGPVTKVRAAAAADRGEAARRTPTTPL